MDAMTLDLLHNALATAQQHHQGLRELRDQLKASKLGGAAPWDAEAAAGELVRRLRHQLDEIEADQEGEAKLDAQLRELGVDPAELDDRECDGRHPLIRHDGSTIYLYDLVVHTGCPHQPWACAEPVRTEPVQQRCYEASWGWVHSRPSCRCPR